MAEYRSLGAVLTDLMKRSKLKQSDLARRVGKSRYTVGRWIREGARLTEDDIAILKKAFIYVEDGVLREPSDQEMFYLRLHGRCLLDVEPMTVDRPINDRSADVDQCTVYSTSYTPQAFPSRWSRRLVEAEHETDGNIYLLADNLAPATRPADFYEHSFHREFYDSTIVDLYSQEWRDYLRFFERERLNDVVIQHVYERAGLNAWVHGEGADWRDRYVPLDIRLQQLRTLLGWIEEDKIEVALTTRTVPSCFKIVGHQTVLLEFTQGSRFLKRANLLGLEIRGTLAVQQFKDQFDSIWKSGETERDQARVVQDLQSMLRSANEARRPALTTTHRPAP